MRKILTGIFLLSYFFGFAQIRKEINLSANIEKATEFIDAGLPIELVIKNKAIPNQYDISINRVFQQIPPLQQPKLSALHGSTACDELLKIMPSVRSETDEVKLAVVRSRMEILMQEASQSCKDYSEADLLNQSLDQRILISPLKKGERVEITIKRLGSAKTWTAIFTTGEKGSWRASYGFAFIPDGLSQEKKYFLDSDNKITKENSEGVMWDYAPSIFFNWFPAKSQAKDFSIGLSGGLGMNFNAKPIVFLGISATYNYNISVNLGLAAHQLKYLKGRYSEGQIINESNFDEEDGLHQRRIKINPCISLSFRFEQNPFK